MNNFRRYTRALLPIAAVSLVLLAFAFYAIGVVDRHSYHELAEERFMRMERLISENQQKRTIVLEEIRSDYLTRARIISMMLSTSPNLLETENALEELRIAVSCDTISISDSKGIITHTTAQSVEGAKVDSAFLAGTNDRTFSDMVVQGSGAEAQVLVGTARLDATGVVQLTFQPSDLNRLLSGTELSAIVANASFMKSGTLSIIDSEFQYISHTDPTQVGTVISIPPERFTKDEGRFSVRLQSMDSYVFYRTSEEKILLCTISKDELYSRRNTVLGWMLAVSVAVLLLTFLQIHTRLKHSA